MTTNKSSRDLWSAVLETYFEDAKDMEIDFKDLYRHACSDHTKSILLSLGIDRAAFLTALKATRKQTRFEFRQQDNMDYAKEQAKEIKSSL